MTQNTNPLADFYRNPKIYLALPSGTGYYTEDIVEMPDVGELPIYPMTAKDDLLTKNPDALLNGDAVIKLVKSCVPAVKKPAELLAPDMEAVLIAIRSASSKNKFMEVNRNCEKCGEPNVANLDLSVQLATAQEVTPLKEITLSNGLECVLSPTNYIHTVQGAKAIIEQNRNFRSINTENNDEQLKALGEAFEKLSTMNYEVILKSIRSISVPNGDTVSDPVLISEFLENVERDIGIELNDAVSKINNGGVSKSIQMQCEKCEHVFETPINYDPVGFFLNS
jgi:hypothetical protein|tara:strand:+ start:3914 stop:4756 length:843 start_codon:yes stop_codon:yes gene_type:complete